MFCIKFKFLSYDNQSDLISQKYSSIEIKENFYDALSVDIGSLYY
jgi:hypothetical protein